MTNDSIRGCVRPSVRQSVCWSIGHAFMKIAEKGVMQDEGAPYVVYTALLDLQVGFLGSGPKGDEVL